MNPINAGQRLWRELARRGWTQDDFRCLLQDGMPEKILTFIREKSSPDLHALIDGAQKIENVFTEDLTETLGYSRGLRTRFLNHLRSYGKEPSIVTLADFLMLSKRTLFMRPGVSKRSIEYVEDMLGALGLMLPEF